MPLDIKVVIDDDIILDVNGSENEYHIVHNILENDIETLHLLKIIISGKTDEHTLLDNDGNLIKSSEVIVSNIAFNDIDLTNFLLKNDDLMTYTHNKNGYSDEVTEAFDPRIGFNGTAELKFKTPIYEWLFTLC
jgi:hypothetical protein